jgi:hypothetical protein
MIGRECRLLVAVHGRRFWGYVPSQHPHFPLLALPNIYRRPEALHFNRISAFHRNSLTPFSDPPCLVASRTDSVRGILIRLALKVVGMKLLEHVCIPFFYGLSTVNGSGVCHKYSVVVKSLPTEGASFRLIAASYFSWNLCGSIVLSCFIIASRGVT